MAPLLLVKPYRQIKTILHMIAEAVETAPLCIWTIGFEKDTSKFFNM